jgi:7-cyano-7-deazaguanine reductase
MSVTQLDNSQVSRHLGQTSNYARDYDPKLLVREPRAGNRVHLKLDGNNLPFCGYDIWNAYEVSCMTELGRPVTAVAKIMYPCDNKYIVESKSLKLYFNSYNMTRFGKTGDECLDIVKDMVERDLSDLLQTNVIVSLYEPSSISSNAKPYFNKTYKTLEDDSGLMDSIEFTQFSETPNILSGTGPYGATNYLIDQRFHSSLLKSNCRVTGQPDWGDVYIHIKSVIPLLSSDIVRYIVSFRDECHFHEEICETIYKRLWDTYKPQQLAVTCLYARRGGIDINPTRVSHVDLLNNQLIDPEIPFTKTSRQ